jgi:hypothetical protein
MRRLWRAAFLVALVAAVTFAFTAGSVLAKPKPKPKKHKTGPLEGCVFITDNGNSSTENVEVFDHGAGGSKGKVAFSGPGLNQTMPFTLAANGTAVVPFTVTSFGMSTITVTVSAKPPMSYKLQFTLGSTNDVTQTSCTPD